jgi:hypothetical protein
MWIRHWADINGRVYIAQTKYEETRDEAEDWVTSDLAHIDLTEDRDRSTICPALSKDERFMNGNLFLKWVDNWYWLDIYLLLDTYPVHPEEPE